MLNGAKCVRSFQKSKGYEAGGSLVRHGQRHAGTPSSATGIALKDPKPIKP